MHSIKTLLISLREENKERKTALKHKEKQLYDISSLPLFSSLSEITRVLILCISDSIFSIFLIEFRRLHACDFSVDGSQLLTLTLHQFEKVSHPPQLSPFLAPLFLARVYLEQMSCFFL